MSFEITIHKTASSPQDVKVKLLIKELGQIGWITHAEEFDRFFKRRLKEMPRTNIFSPNNSYKVVYSGRFGEWDQRFEIHKTGRNKQEKWYTLVKKHALTEIL